jgi:peptidoglycan/xylan/chitin deacetylase (PgdA/CDA1 family)
MIITLLYHHVNDDFTNNITISTANFRQQMQFLRDSTCRVISLDTALTTSKPPDDGLFILLTFDDGYEDFYTNAFPILQEFGFAAVVFPIVEAIGHWNEWNRRAPYMARHLSWQQIIELSRANIYFGCHTLSHHSLVRFNGRRQYREMARAKHQLEDRLGQAIRSISYPYGDYNDATKQLAAELFEVGFTVDHGYWRWGIDPFAIRRLKVGPTTTPTHLSETLESITHTADVLPPLSMAPDVKT